MVADHKLKLIILGESGVGKTSLMLRFCKNIYKDIHSYTSIDYHSKTIVLQDQTIELHLWDTAGQERFKSIVKEYFRKADGAILAYDTTNLETFTGLPIWLEELRELKEDVAIIIVGNKNDLPHRNQVTRAAVELYSQKEGLDFYETSAKNNENVEEVFKNLALKVLEKRRISPFYEEVANGQTEQAANSGNAASGSVSEETENNNLPPIVSLEENFGDIGIDSIKLTIEKPKRKQKKCC